MQKINDKSLEDVTRNVILNNKNVGQASTPALKLKFIDKPIYNSTIHTFPNHLH